VPPKQPAEVIIFPLTLSFITKTSFSVSMEGSLGIGAMP
jgi:hypothetical protein